MISAHESSLAAIAFDVSATRIATASNKVCSIEMEIKTFNKIIYFSKGYSYSYS